MDIKESIVKITYKDELLGTGFFISKQGYVLTCAHLFKDLSEDVLELVKVDNKSAKIIEREYSENSDFAVLKIDFLPTEIYPLHIDFTYNTEETLAVKSYGYGNSEGGEPTAFLGEISQKIGRAVKLTINRDRQVLAGDSGGPLIKDDKIIGLIFKDDETDYYEKKVYGAYAYLLSSYKNLINFFAEDEIEEFTENEDLKQLYKRKQILEKIIKKENG